MSRSHAGKSHNPAVKVARAFFHACTKHSEDREDILPQEDAPECQLSVYSVFADLFPQYAGSGKDGLLRLRFNKIGYELYEKGQSRRVPASKAKPGNPGYGFRLARWRNPLYNAEDNRICELAFNSVGIPHAKIEDIKQRINLVRKEWDDVRRPRGGTYAKKPSTPTRSDMFPMHDPSLPHMRYSPPYPMGPWGVPHPGMPMGPGFGGPAEWMGGPGTQHHPWGGGFGWGPATMACLQPGMAQPCLAGADMANPGPVILPARGFGWSGWEGYWSMGRLPPDVTRESPLRTSAGPLAVKPRRPDTILPRLKG
jgi:hypothetical protein